MMPSLNKQIIKKYTNDIGNKEGSSDLFWNISLPTVNAVQTLQRCRRDLKPKNMVLE